MDWIRIDEFLLDACIPMYGITLALALWRYPYYFDTPLRFYPILLFYTFLNEILGAAVKNSKEFILVTHEFYRSYNWVIYNVYTVVFYLYFFFIFWKLGSSVHYKKWIVFSASIFMATVITNPFLQHILVPQVYTYSVGGILLIICILLYLINTKLKAITLSEKFVLWLCAGVLLFYTGYIPIKILRYYYTMEDIHEPSIIRRIHLLLILGMYSLISIGFIRMRRNKQASTITY
tara:strand:+ start:43224 stop:43925 length:702 start_codon:yes stop_codon:yes gene_type:complete